MEPIITILKKYTQHKHLELTSRGNTAIDVAFQLLKKKGIKKILLPDQGTWIHYLKAAKAYNVNIELVKTDNALLDLKDLKEKLSPKSAFIYVQLAAYILPQPIAEIQKACQKAKVPIVMDVTGSIGTATCNGTYADYLICSFGKHKPIAAAYGGFISSKKERLTIPKQAAFDQNNEPKLKKALELLSIKHWLYGEMHNKVKHDLRKYDIIHRDLQGINIIIKYKNEKEKAEIINYCSKHNFKYRLTTKVKDTTKHSMSFIKINQNAVSIDIQEI